jgi:hypothetical protein
MLLRAIISTLHRRTGADQPAPGWVHIAVAFACVIATCVAIGMCYVPTGGSVSDTARVRAVTVDSTFTLFRGREREHRTRWLTLTTHDGGTYSAIDDVVGTPEVGDVVTISHSPVMQQTDATPAAPVERLERADLPGLTWNSIMVSLAALALLVMCVLQVRRARVVGLGDAGRRTRIDD